MRMSNLAINLEWAIDPAGYQLIDAGTSSATIAGKSGDLFPNRPLAGNDTHFREFANIKTPTALLAFVEKYGLLDSPKTLAAGIFRMNEAGELVRTNPPRSIIGEKVSEHLATAGQFRTVMKATVKGRRHLMSVVKSHAPDVLDRALGEITIQIDQRLGLRLSLSATSLLDAMWLQLVQQVLGNAWFKVCSQCSGMFQAGIAGRRADAKFCSKECQITFNSHKRRIGA